MLEGGGKVDNLPISSHYGVTICLRSSVFGFRGLRLAGNEQKYCPVAPILGSPFVFPFLSSVFGFLGFRLLSCSRALEQSFPSFLPPYTVLQLTHGYRRIREELAGYAPRRALRPAPRSGSSSLSQGLQALPLRKTAAPAKLVRTDNCKHAVQRGSCIAVKSCEWTGQVFRNLDCSVRFSVYITGCTVKQSACQIRQCLNVSLKQMYSYDPFAR